MLGHRSGAPATALRFLAVARLGLGRSSSQVAEELEMARSPVVECFRLGKAELDALRQIKEVNGLESDTEALRLALRFYLRESGPGFGPRIRRALGEEVRAAVERALKKPGRGPRGSAAEATARRLRRAVAKGS